MHLALCSAKLLFRFSFWLIFQGHFFYSTQNIHPHTVYPKEYAHGFVVLCFVVVMQSFIMNSHEVFIHIHQGCFAGTGAIVRLPQCQWSKPDGYGKISQCITTTKHSKAKTVCIFLGIYCSSPMRMKYGVSVVKSNLTYILPLSYYDSTMLYIDGFVQDRHNSTVLTMELHLSCNNPSEWYMNYILKFIQS